jgi:TPR repeat protein
MLFLFEGITFVYADSVKTKWDTLDQEFKVLFQQRKFEQALVVAQKAIKLAEKNGGLNNPEVAISLGHLATTYSLQRESTKAEPLFRRSLEIYEKSLGLNHPTVAGALGNLALCYKAQGKYIKAESAYKKSLKILEKLSISGQELPDIEAQTMVNLAFLYRAMGREKEAFTLEKRADQIKANPTEKKLDKKNVEEVLIKVIQKNVFFNVGNSELMSTVAVYIKNIELNKNNQIVAIGNFETIYTIEGGYREVRIDVGIKAILKNTNILDEKSVLKIYSRNKKGESLELFYPFKKLSNKVKILKEKSIEEIIRVLKKPKKSAPTVQNETRDSSLAKIYASDGSADKQYALGIVFFYGKSVQQSYKEALVWFRRAADQDHVEAQYILGEMYRTGEGIEINNNKAFNWYIKAAKQGHTNAQNNLGLIYARGKGVPRNDNEAFLWYQKSAKQGDAFGQMRLGYMYQKGQGVNKDDAKAVVWYQKSAEQGRASAQNNLGLMYEFGQGVEQNDSKAFNWYRKAAEQGLSDGQAHLGVMYIMGKGVEKNIDLAVVWLKKAAKQGHARAQKHLKSITNQISQINK